MPRVKASFSRGPETDGSRLTTTVPGTRRYATKAALTGLVGFVMTATAKASTVPALMHEIDTTCDTVQCNEYVEINIVPCNVEWYSMQACTCQEDCHFSYHCHDMDSISLCRVCASLLQSGSDNS